MYWLQIQQWIKFNIFTLVYKYLSKQAPSYLHNLLTVNPISDQSMHSNSKFKQLIVPIMKRRTFAIEASVLWVQNTGMNCLMTYIYYLIWKAFTELLKHTYSMKHTIKTQTVNINLF